VCNPLIKNGGMALESKKEIYDLMPKDSYPNTLFFKSSTSFEELINEINKSEIQFPFIVKPDIGLQGLRVEKISTLDELKKYFEKVDYNFLVQELVSFPKEIGLFYYRLPNENKGIISGIVYKEFLIVIGDGKKTIEELIHQNPRFALQYQTLKKKYGDLLSKILNNNESLNLVPFGNHVRGSKFIDVSDWINENLTKTINEICLQIPEFYYGRLDIMFNSREELELGKNYSIIELNGAGSEPTHIYDPNHSIFFGWKEIIRHYKILYQISILNKKRGYKFLSFSKCREMIRENKLLKKHLKAIS
jgi:hypothetical protein